MKTLTVSSFGYSPMKGTRHMQRRSGHLVDGFLQEDRRLCLVDLTSRKVIRTVQHPELMAIEVFLDIEKTSAGIVFPGKKRARGQTCST